MSTAVPIEDLGDDDFIPVIPNHHHDAACLCGHRHAEHSMFGSCHGCKDCTDDDPVAAHEHTYQRCACTNFQLATDAVDLALTG